jgi:hypothetical protein
MRLRWIHFFISIQGKFWRGFYYKSCLMHIRIAKCLLKHSKRFVLSLSICIFIHTKEIISKLKIWCHYFLTKTVTWSLLCTTKFKFLWIIFKALTLYLLFQISSFQIRHECCILAFREYVWVPEFVGLLKVFLFPCAWWHVFIPAMFTV